jgi:hypothetical protein
MLGESGLPKAAFSPALGLGETLVGLCLRGNDLASLPPFLCGALNHLTSLVLSSNRLTTLPSELALLGRLEVLAIDRNQLKAIPDVVFDLPALLRLNAQVMVLLLRCGWRVSTLATCSLFLMVELFETKKGSCRIKLAAHFMPVLDPISPFNYQNVRSTPIRRPPPSNRRTKSPKSPVRSSGWAVSRPSCSAGTPSRPCRRNWSTSHTTAFSSSSS